MDNSDSDQIPERIRRRVRTDAHSFITRDKDLTQKYRYGNKIDHEPVIGIQKEIDGMARLLCALVTQEGTSGNPRQYLEVYQNEVERLRELEHEVISELPEREQNK